MKRVLVFGTFDLFHKGHGDFLRQARACGETLTVIVARDVNAKHLKGAQPIDDERTRLQNVSRDASVSQARLGYEDRAQVYQVLDDVKPDMICLGYDQTGFADRLPAELAARGYSIPVVRLEPYEPQKFKSSLLRTSLKDEIVERVPFSVIARSRATKQSRELSEIATVRPASDLAMT